MTSGQTTAIQVELRDPRESRRGREFLRQSVESSDDRLVDFAACSAHCIQCNTVDNTSDWLNRDRGELEHGLFPIAS